MFGKKTAVATAGQTQLSDQDDLGRYPNEVNDQPTQAKAQERTLRVVSLVAVVSGLTNVAFLMLFWAMFPLQKVYPYLVTFKSQDNQVVSIEPLAIDAPGILYATEDNVRDYVVQRHSFTPILRTMEAQWGPGSRLAAKTDPELFKKFEQDSKKELSDMMTAGYSREITINSVTRVNDDTWQVAFTTTDRLPTAGGTLTGNSAFGVNPSTAGVPGDAQAVSSPVETKQEWVATMRVAYLPKNVTYDKRLLNPLGFTVTDYSVSRRS